MNHPDDCDVQLGDQMYNKKNQDKKPLASVPGVYRLGSFELSSPVSIAGNLSYNNTRINVLLKTTQLRMNATQLSRENLVLPCGQIILYFSFAFIWLTILFRRKLVAYNQDRRKCQLAAAVIFALTLELGCKNRKDSQHFYLGKYGGVTSGYDTV